MTTVVVAWLALLVSTTTLAWQIVSWRRSGAHITVNGSVVDDGERTVLRVHIVNHGRYPATVTELGYYSSDTQRRPRGRDVLNRMSDVAGGQLPLRLEGQADFEHEIYLGEYRALQQMLRKNPQHSLFPYAQVRGRPIYGKRLNIRLD
ncbi:hypothetical protein AB0C38_43510 [Amycolatopsis sp. NPDC048633]|uniref:hypothetical protein n=1 Tax=Amycolatopsis sp. NPDC048633 TaxID=3157095 RepID=UPI00340F8129